MATSGVCAVLGFGPGIGAAVARRFSAGGFKVALVSRTREKIEEAAKGIANSKAFCADVTNAAALTATLASIEGDLGPITALIYNAGNGVWKPYDAITVDQVSFDLATAGLPTCRFPVAALAAQLFPGCPSDGHGAEDQRARSLGRGTVLLPEDGVARRRLCVCYGGDRISARNCRPPPTVLERRELSCFVHSRRHAKCSVAPVACSDTCGARQVCHTRRPLPLPKRPSGR